MTRVIYRGEAARNPHRYLLPMFGCKVVAGFPSPADDYIECELDINDLLVAHPAATFFVTVGGDSMIDAGIFPGDKLVVDRSITPHNHHIVIAAVDGELTCKRLHFINDYCLLVSENQAKAYPNIEIKEDRELIILGVVRGSIRQFDL